MFSERLVRVVINFSTVYVILVLIYVGGAYKMTFFFEDALD